MLVCSILQEGSAVIRQRCVTRDSDSDSSRTRVRLSEDSESDSDSRVRHSDCDSYSKVRDSDSDSRVRDSNTSLFVSNPLSIFIPASRFKMFSRQCYMRDKAIILCSGTIRSVLIRTQVIHRLYAQQRHAHPNKFGAFAIS